MTASLEEMEDGEDLFNPLLCDELLAEVLCRVPAVADQKCISLVCRRWLLVQRRAKTSLGLCVPNDATFSYFCSSIHSFLKQHPHVTTLAVISEEIHRNSESLGEVLDAIASCCKFLRQLHFSAGPINFAGLQKLAEGCSGLTSLQLLHLQIRDLPILGEFKSLTELSLAGCFEGEKHDLMGTPQGSLHVERLCLEGISGSNSGLGWLWRSCSRLKKLEFFNCEGIGDTDTLSFVHCLPSLQEIQLHRCRSIASGVLELVSEYCPGLRSLLFHDGGDTEGLQHVIHKCKALQVLDLRLPLDLSNEDLVAIAQSCGSLRSFRLHSCYLATGAGMRLLATNIKSNLEELVLVSCRAVVQDSGTLSVLGQHLRGLKSLDLSDNDHLADNELVSMLSSCKNLLQLRLWRCRRLTDKVVEFITQKCPMLQSIDMRSCDKISPMAVATLLSGCQNLRKIGVEMIKLTSKAKALAFSKGVAVIESVPSNQGRTKLLVQNMHMELDHWVSCHSEYVYGAWEQWHLTRDLMHYKPVQSKFPSFI